MIKWLRATPPEVGSIWTSRIYGDPFKAYDVEILGVKKGWVKYRHASYSPHARLSDEAEPIRAFRSRYKELVEKEVGDE